MELDHLSYSSISAYLDCPENWRRKYIAKEPTQSSPALAFGSAFHGTIEKFVTAPEADIIETWNQQWSKAIEGQPIFWGLDTPEAIYNDGVRMFSNATLLSELKKIAPGIDDQGHKIERRVELRVPGVPIPIIGYIDIILADGTPADFKTSAKSWTDDKAQESLQSLFYLAAMNQMGIPVNWKFKHIVFVKTKEPKVQMLEHSHKPGELFFLFDLISRVWRGIEHEVYPMNPGTWKCSEKYCDFWSGCRGKYQ
jgi:putative RecB family exonuclease